MRFCYILSTLKRSAPNSRIILGVYFFFYPLAFCCLSVAKLLVLDRMFKFNSRHLEDHVIAQFVRFLTIAMRTVCVLNVIVVVACFTSAGLWLRSYELQLTLANQYANNVTNPDASDVEAMTASAKRAASAAYASELVVLLVLALSFLIFGGLFIVRLIALGDRLQQSALTAQSETNPGSGAKKNIALITHAQRVQRSLWLRVVCSVGNVFVSFVLRCVYDAMYVSTDQAAFSSACRGLSNCDPCHPTLFIISNWLSPSRCLFAAVLATLPHTKMLLTFTAGWTSPPSSLPPSRSCLSQSLSCWRFGP